MKSNSEQKWKYGWTSYKEIKKTSFFYWTNEFTERYFSEKKKKKIDGKLTIILRTNKINFFTIK